MSASMLWLRAMSCEIWKNELTSEAFMADDVISQEKGADSKAGQQELLPWEGGSATGTQ